uniref:Putative lipocalin-3 1 n=1 Tax=Amblyomma cajennense TaxID=34607 RepID=A0A023FCI7_AMBCJ
MWWKKRLLNSIMPTQVSPSLMKPPLITTFRKLLVKDQVVWVLNTTEPGNVTCRKDVISTVQDDKVSFQRSFRNKTDISEENLKGTMINWYHEGSTDFYDGFEIQDSEGDIETQEILEYINDENTCAVVKVMKVRLYSDGKTGIWRELRLIGDAVEKTVPADCIREFDEEVKAREKPSRIAYNSQCRGNAGSV